MAMTKPAQIIFWFTLAVLVAVLSGCVSQRPVISQQLSDAARQQRQMNAPDASRWPQVQNRAMTLAVAPVAVKIVHIQADAVAADGYNLYGGTKLDRSDWSLRATSPLPDFAVLGDNAFEWFGMRAFLRNGIDGSQTEGGWATR